jgi:GntR family transcriptional regulator, transcriptional repressor for pyruvate dehydrogenase complex
MAFRPVSKVPVYLQIAEQLSDAILAGDLPPGTVLPPERELAESFRASRASIREALRALQAQGLILDREGAPMRAIVAGEASPVRRAALVGLLRFDTVPLADLVEFRCVIESAALRWAAAAADRGRLDRVRAALEAMDDPALTAEDFDEADVAFHTELVRASGNEAMHQVMAALHDPVARHMRETRRGKSRPEVARRRLVAEHHDMLTAVEAGAGDRAADLVIRHIRGYYGTALRARR